MSNSTALRHYPSISDSVLIDTGARDPVYAETYPRLRGFELGLTHSWTRGHPWDYYQQMREQAPVMWSTMKRPASGFWSVSRYEDVKQVELNPALFSSQRGSMNIALLPSRQEKARRLINAAQNSLINMDADLHRDLRTQQAHFFFPKYVETLKTKVAAKIDALLDDMERAGPVVDFVKLFSSQLPLFTLCEMLGVDPEDRSKISHWMHYLELAPQFLSHPWRMLLAEPLFPLRFNGIIDDMFQYGEQVMADRIARPRDDLLTTIANATLDKQPLSQDYLDGSWLLIIFAGNDTTRNSLSGTIRLLTAFPDQRERVLADPGLIDGMVQESLRMVSPVMHMRRTAMEDTEIAGQRIAKDEKVIMWYGAANRDPSVFEQPDVFDITRPNADKHLAFGHGVHRCLGNRIAQLQLRLALQKILERFPNIHWTGKQTISPIILVHAIARLQVNLYGPEGKRPVQIAAGR